MNKHTHATSNDMGTLVEDARALMAATADVAGEKVGEARQRLADTLEHAISERVLERMDALLGHPTADPHGDPIPTSKGHLHERRLISLADCPVGIAQQVARVLDQEPEFLQFIDRSGLKPGSIVTVAKRDAAAEAVKIQIPRRREVSLGLAAAAKILVDAPTTNGS